MRTPSRDITAAVRVAGAVLLAIGVMCLPLGYSVNPKRDQSVFHNLADMGGFVRVGVIVGLVGLSLLVAGSVMRRHED
jgi:hypothetical protein